MQRAAYDLVGIHAQDGPDRRKWLRHARLARRRHSAAQGVRNRHQLPDLRTTVIPSSRSKAKACTRFAVGPVHAGTIEPGHFRFSIVGEKVLRLEERLGYKHKGIEKRFETMTLPEGARLAGRVRGDSTVAYAWAYAMAVEGASGTEPPRRALWLRALVLELERIANHLGDLGYLGNDVAFAFGFVAVLAPEGGPAAPAGRTVRPPLPAWTRSFPAASRAICRASRRSACSRGCSRSSAR